MCLLSITTRPLRATHSTQSDPNVCHGLTEPFALSPSSLPRCFSPVCVTEGRSNEFPPADEALRQSKCSGVEEQQMERAFIGRRQLQLRNATEGFRPPPNTAPKLSINHSQQSLLRHYPLL
ncbi:hypothetical protein VZT92_012714 [Zoarces viviparus]|uniref:Uncharacterized protein n=1 Tax=Zoarces viviparus TaxID=48416 RepID=A0AAW1F148_ZOAVI